MEVVYIIGILAVLLFGRNFLMSFFRTNPLILAALVGVVLILVLSGALSLPDSWTCGGAVSPAGCP